MQEKSWMRKEACALLADLNDAFTAKWSEHPSFEVMNSEVVTPIITYLEKRRRGFPTWDILKAVEHFKNINAIGYTFFFRDVLPKIQEVARTSAEADALIAAFLEHVLSIITRPIYAHMEQKGLMPTPLDILEKS